ncbi:hypothetical protein CAC42_4606 [Sphaceloma murrayae]|uniref:Uncharacterized protein n=1 Tax=Sphaceloma murrayae TaxID=2082308 RepID=A0A2K1QNS2_9PEZI|nr:hypothetical protein CAC42_4606 [Sphaceloma murrayae]
MSETPPTTIRSLLAGGARSPRSPSNLKTSVAVMQQASYASVSQLRQNGGHTGIPAKPERRTDNQGSQAENGERHREKDPSHQPKTSTENEEMYILTLRTDKNLHETMTNLRSKHFPPKLNHLDAHITLFHALPKSKLDSHVIPAVKEVTQATTKFELGATTPFKLKKGIAIGMPKDHGGNASRDLHSKLVRKWSDFLSQQDFSFQAHYTIMNKVEDREHIDEAFRDVKDGWKACFGTAEGITLYRYHPSAWHWQADFDFQDRR